MQSPNIILFWPSIVVAIIAAFVFGFLWYGPLFGKKWAALMNIKMDKKPDGKFMTRALSLQVVGLFLTTYVLAHTLQVWRPSVWGVGADGPDGMYGFLGGFFTWIAFYIPNQLSKVNWEGRPWPLFALNSAHDFFLLQLISQILARWH